MPLHGRQPQRFQVLYGYKSTSNRLEFMDRESTATKKAIAALAVVALLTIIGGSSYLLQRDNDSADTAIGDKDAAEVVFTPLPAQTDESQASDNTFNNGQYTVVKRYFTPEGTESIKVTIILEDDVVKSVATTASRSVPEAIEHQGDFLAAYEPRVVGKPIGTLSLSRLAGASLTTAAFNDVLDDIREEARI